MNWPGLDKVKLPPPPPLTIYLIPVHWCSSVTPPTVQPKKRTHSTSMCRCFRVCVCVFVCGSVFFTWSSLQWVLMLNCRVELLVIMWLRALQLQKIQNNLGSNSAHSRTSAAERAWVFIILSFHLCQFVGLYVSLFCKLEIYTENNWSWSWRSTLVQIRIRGHIPEFFSGTFW